MGIPNPYFWSAGNVPSLVSDFKFGQYFIANIANRSH